MKKHLILFFLVILTYIFSLTVCAADDVSEEPDFAGDGTVTVETAHGYGKKIALEEANLLVSEGTSPEKTEYFSYKKTRRILSDGYYTITESTTSLCFNVDTDGADNDYEGIRLTVWENTEDITQRFRLVMNEDGSYSFYAACSRGGYSRAVGYDPVSETFGLFSPDSNNISTFFIKNTGDGDGTKYIVLSGDETKYLGFPYDSTNGSAACLCMPNEPSSLCKWKIENWGDIEESTEERAMYPGKILLVTQGPYDEFSHQEQNATDVQVNAGDSLCAPFTCRVMAINEDCGNVVWVQSVSKVMYADGSYDYMTALFMHDDDISDIYIGEIILQGQPFYEMGTAGYAEGTHCHISCFRGEYSPMLKIVNMGDEAVNIWDAFFLPEGIEVRYDYGFPWVYTKAEGSEQTEGTY